MLTKATPGFGSHLVRLDVFQVVFGVAHHKLRVVLVVAHLRELLCAQPPVSIPMHHPFLTQIRHKDAIATEVPAAVCVVPAVFLALERPH